MLYIYILWIRLHATEETIDYWSQSPRPSLLESFVSKSLFAHNSHTETGLRTTMERFPPLYFLPELVQVLEDKGIQGPDQSGYMFMLALKYHENEALDDVDMEVFTFFLNMGLGALEDGENRMHHMTWAFASGISLRLDLDQPNPEGRSPWQVCLYCSEVLKYRRNDRLKRHLAEHTPSLIPRLIQMLFTGSIEEQQHPRAFVLAETPPLAPSETRGYDDEQPEKLTNHRSRTGSQPRGADLEPYSDHVPVWDDWLAGASWDSSSNDEGDSEDDTDMFSDGE